MNTIAPFPSEAAFSFEKAMQDWQKSYEKEAARLTGPVTWHELMIGELCGWLLLFKVPQIAANLMPGLHNLYCVIADRFKLLREHYRFSRMPPAEQVKRLEAMKPSIFKLIAVGVMLVGPFALGLRARK